MATVSTFVVDLQGQGLAVAFDDDLVGLDLHDLGIFNHLPEIDELDFTGLRGEQGHGVIGFDDRAGEFGGKRFGRWWGWWCIWWYWWKGWW